jgi:hypothetical protein
MVAGEDVDSGNECEGEGMEREETEGPLSDGAF